MISYLNGEIVDISFDSIVVDCNGIGYHVYVGKPQDFAYGRCLVHIYYHQKDDGVVLYGFKSKNEKELFLKLIDVNGIGPKTASGMIGATTVQNLISAIETGNLAFLKKLPSIGAKAAQQIILDLKGKLILEDKKPSQSKNVQFEEVYDALRTFDFKVSEIDAAMNKIANLEELKTEQLIKECLKLLRK